MCTALKNPSKTNKNMNDDYKNHKFILLCGDNLNSLGVLRSLGEDGIVPYIILLQEGHISLLSKSKYPKKIIPSSSFEESYRILLAQFSNEAYKPFILTTDDNHEQILDEHYDELVGKFYFFNAGAQGRVTKYMDKMELCKLAEKCGLRVPSSEVVVPGILPKSLKYPVFTKTINPYSEGWKRDVFICNNEEELLEAYQGMVSPALIIQEYVDKVGEISMQGISICGGEKVFLPFERMYLRFSKTNFGGYMYYQRFSNDGLREKIQSMIREIGFSGCFEIEFLVDKNDNLYFLEINLRFSASNYGVNFGGVNQAALWAKSTLGNSIIADSNSIRDRRFYVINEPEDVKYIRKVGICCWIKQFLTADSYYLFNAKDPVPMLSFWFQKLTRKLKK